MSNKDLDLAQKLLNDASINTKKFPWYDQLLDKLNSLKSSSQQLEHDDFELSNNKKDIKNSDDSLAHNLDHSSSYHLDLSDDNSLESNLNNIDDAFELSSDSASFQTTSKQSFDSSVSSYQQFHNNDSELEQIASDFEHSVTEEDSMSSKSPVNEDNESNEDIIDTSIKS